MDAMPWEDLKRAAIRPLNTSSLCKLAAGDGTWRRDPFGDLDLLVFLPLEAAFSFLKKKIC